MRRGRGKEKSIRRGISTFLLFCSAHFSSSLHRIFSETRARKLTTSATSYSSSTPTRSHPPILSQHIDRSIVKYLVSLTASFDVLLPSKSLPSRRVRSLNHDKWNPKYLAVAVQEEKEKDCEVVGNNSGIEKWKWDIARNEPTKKGIEKRNKRRKKKSGC